MFRNRTFAAVAAAIMLLAVVFSACVAPAAPAAAPAADSGAAAPAAEGKIKIGVSMLFDDLWLTILRDAITAAAEADGNVELIMVDSKEDVATQLSQVENFVTQGVDAIILIPPNTDATDPATKLAVDAGIPLVYVNRKPANLPEGVYYVGSDSIIAGHLQMEWLAEKMGGKGNLVIMNGNLSQEAAQQRTAGVKEIAAKFPDIKIIKEDTANWSRAEGLALMENWLSTGDEINAVAANNDEMAIGALEAIKSAGKLGTILVGGVDASPDALASMDKGELNMTVFQNAAGQGEGGIKTAIALARGEKLDSQIVWVDYEQVTPENYKEYMK